MNEFTSIDGRIKLLNCDCMEYMKELSDNYFDLAIVDPPYFSGPEKRFFYGKAIPNNGIKRIQYAPLEQSWNIPDNNYYQELKRVSKNQIIWGINYFNTFNSIPAGRIVWDKVNEGSSFSNCEIASCSLINTVRIFRYMWRGMMQGRGNGTCMSMQGNKSLNEKKIHPTQKPIALYKWLLHHYAKEGYKILDTHLGSGSSAIAAYQWGGGICGM